MGKAGPTLAALKYLSPAEQSALAEFLAALRARFGAQIEHVWFYGSKARGDFDEESDIDLLVVAEDDEAVRGEIGHLVLQINLEYETMLSEHVVSRWRFTQMRVRREFIYENIVRDGRDLWRSPVHRSQSDRGCGGRDPAGGQVGTISAEDGVFT